MHYTLMQAAHQVTLTDQEKRALQWLSCLCFLMFAVPCVWAGADASTRKPNIVLITIESLRADRGGSKYALPNLDSLAKESLAFERAYAQAPLTVVSHATILTGTYPQVHRASELGNSLSTAVPYLPELLRSRGYRTAAFVGSILLDPRNGFASGFERGFDVYDAGFQLFQPNTAGSRVTSRNGAQVIARASAWLSRNSKDAFFLWVHLDDARGRSRPAYGPAVRMADAALGRLISFLRARELYENSLIVVTSDHGESLGTHGEATHGIFLYEETLHVPLILKMPKGRAAQRIRGRVRQVDIAPSLLEAANLPVPSGMQGQSLLRMAKTNPNSDAPVYGRTDFPEQAFGWSRLESWRSSKYLYIRAPKPELYDLSVDPGATHNLSAASKATLDTMAAQLSAFNNNLQKSGKTEAGGLTSTEVEKLASLGYVGLQRSAPKTDAQFLGTDPKDTIGNANRVLEAMLALYRGEVGKAIAQLRQIVATQPKLFLAQYGLGMALVEQGHYAEARERLHTAIELHPDSGWTQYLMGVCLMKLGDLKTAAVHLEIASRQLPSLAGAHAALAEVYDRLGRREDANRERSKISP